MTEPNETQEALHKVWTTDAPDGQAWSCPDCDSWATLGGNAGWHAEKSGHGLPTLKPMPPRKNETAQGGHSDAQFREWANGYFGARMLRTDLDIANQTDLLNCWHAAQAGAAAKPIDAATVERERDFYKGKFESAVDAVVLAVLRSRGIQQERQAAYLRDVLLSQFDPLFIVTQRLKETGRWPEPDALAQAEANRG